MLGQTTTTTSNGNGIDYQMPQRPPVNPLTRIVSTAAYLGVVYGVIYLVTPD